MNEPLHIISLGAGVQSSTLALMAARGEVGPMPTAAVFSDTHAEPSDVYAWLDWLEKQLPFPVYRVTRGSLTERSLTIFKNRKTGKKYIKNMIPAFVRNDDGSRGIVGRRCTYDHKIIPLTQKARQLLGAVRMRKWREVNKALLAALCEAKKAKRPLNGILSRLHAGAPVVQWIGISLDEVQRMKPSREPWSRHRWPLIEKEMSRHDCLRWMERNGFPTPPRSACTYCPFHSDHEWRRLKEGNPGAFAHAVKFERDLQKLHATKGVLNKMNSVPFLHDSLRPLDQVDFSEDVTQGQLKFGNECEGMCGV